jgi:hypothetical protein
MFLRTTFPPDFCPNRIHTNWEYEIRKPLFLQKTATDSPHTAQKRLPSKQFQVLLTPSSGSFSSFPHGTCSLSVSRPYLALDGTYHPLRAAIPNNSTLGLSTRTQRQKEVRGYHSLWQSFPGTLALLAFAA